MTRNGDGNSGRHSTGAAGTVARMLAGTGLVIWGATILFRALFEFLRIGAIGMADQNWLIGALAVLLLGLAPLLWGIWLVRRV